ncbi:hypothetical protein AVEN_4311-1 [Araneus ventricosus]|uniref:Uncharacterized protein n=1 Tax=Araneus ventricosus TaxID=182803 RepID=A0A4Y2GGX8_ARAVE|nr:hypothetical protein AVEN_4311-1 [Araneus ventricosus]
MQCWYITVLHRNNHERQGRRFLYKARLKNSKVSRASLSQNVSDCTSRERTVVVQTVTFCCTIPQEIIAKADEDKDWGSQYSKSQVNRTQVSRAGFYHRMSLKSHIQKTVKPPFGTVPFLHMHGASHLMCAPRRAELLCYRSRLGHLWQGDRDRNLWVPDRDLTTRQGIPNVQWMWIITPQ